MDNMNTMDFNQKIDVSLRASLDGNSRRTKRFR